MSNIAILRADAPGMRKHWTENKEDQPKPPMWFAHEMVPVSSLEDLDAAHRRLTAEGNAFTVLGTYRGDVHAAGLGPEFHRPGLVRRTKETFEDAANEAFPVDADGWTPPAGLDPQADPDNAVRAFIAGMPHPWRDADWLVRLSGSMGSPHKPRGELRARLTAWLPMPMTAAQKKVLTGDLQRAMGGAAKVDPSICDEIQPDYLADPDPRGMRDPFAGNRHRGIFKGPAGLLRLDPPMIAPLPPRTVAVSPSASGPCPEWSGPADDDELLRLGRALPRPAWAVFAQARGEAVPELADFMDGNIAVLAARFPTVSGKPFGASEADFALCRELAYLTGRDAARIERLRQEAAIFPYLKDDPAYVARTIRKACEKAVTVLGQHLKPGEQADVMGFSPSDAGNAQRLMRLLGGHVIANGGEVYVYAAGRGLWVSGKGALYAAWNDVPGEVLREAAFLTTQAVTAGADGDDLRKRAEALLKWAGKCRQTAVREAAIAWLMPLVETDADKLDADPHLLNCVNGVVNLRTGALLAHDADYLMTRQCSADYDAHAGQAAWGAAIGAILGLDMTDYLQRIAGYTATGENSGQILPIHVGEGENGKSLMMETLRRTLGSYAATASPDLLMDKGSGGGPTPELVDLRSVRMLICHESRATDRLDEGRVKTLTGGDRVRARRLYASHIEFTPSFKVHLATNHKPEVAGTDHGIWRRLRIIPYGTRFGSEDEVAAGLATQRKDVTLLDRLTTAEGLRGVLAWIVAGAVKWYDTRDLTPPERALTAGAEYRAESDRVAQFVAEGCPPRHNTCRSDRT